MARIDDIEYEKRIRIVMEWILDDWRSVDIISQIVIKWGLESRQAKRYVAEARKRWLKDETIIIEQKRKYKSESLKKLKRSLNERFKGTPEGIRAVLMVEKEIIALEGLAMPTKIAQTNTSGEDLPQLKTIIVMPATEKDSIREDEN